MQPTMQNAVDIAIQRILKTYSLMGNEQKAEEARDRVTSYLQTLFAGGETDGERLAVCGLVYLREKEGRSDPVREGFSGL